MKIYTVGGAVRDRCLGLEPQDIDYVVVGSSPREMLDLGFKQVGADFPVFLDEKGQEYALARVERKTGAGYGGFSTETNNVTLEEDLSRRDLTINSMAMDDQGNVIDPYGGLRDLKNKVLRHTSAAFSEDPLRVIRLARFYARYTDFEVAPETISLCVEIVKSGRLNELSVERMWAELDKVFKEENPSRFFSLLWGFGVFNYPNFFSKLYGGPYPVPSLDFINVSKALAFTPNALTIHVALFGKNLETATSKTQELAACVRWLERSGRNSESVMTLLTLAKSGKQGSLVPLLADLLTVQHFWLSKTELLLADMLMASVRAETYLEPNGPYKPGKELGEKLKAEKLALLSRAFN